MTTEEMELIYGILKAICWGGAAYIILSWLKQIVANTTHIRESLDYIIDKMEQSAADNTLDEIEEELSTLRKDWNDTRR